MISDEQLGDHADMVKLVTLLESDLPKLICAGPLSMRTTYTLRVAGPWSAVEARNLMKILELHIECLDMPPNNVLDRTERSKE